MTELDDAIDTLKRTTATLAATDRAISEQLDRVDTALARINPTQPRVRRWLIDLLLVVLIIAAGVLGVLL